MKPRTKIEKEVEVLRMKLPPISKSQKEWAKEHCFLNIGYVCKDEVWCSHCGKTHIMTIPELAVALKVEKKTSCPYCHKVLKLEVSCARKKETMSVMTIVTCIGGWQVLRHVELVKYLYKNKEAVNVDCISVYMKEVVNQWINDNGCCVVVASNRGLYNSRYNFIWTSDMSIKNVSRLGGYEKDIYNIMGEVYPIKKVIPILKRNGYDGYIPRSVSMCDLFMCLLNKSEAETMVKARQYKLLELLVRRNGLCRWMWPSVKIAIRNKYKVNDANLWVDMLEALRFLGKDLRNSHYVCPKNLKEAHDRWIKLKQEIKKKQEKEEKIKAINREEEKYHSEKSKYFGISLCGEGIKIEPIKSVAEMEEEGRIMHHCVFANDYYKKKDSLILSAKDESGNRLETVEVILSTGKVNQCFGAYNKFTKWHERILDIVKNNMNVIMEAV